MLWKTIDIAEHERGLLFQQDYFGQSRNISVLKPGRHRISRFGSATRFERHDVSDPAFIDKNAQFLLEEHSKQLAGELASWHPQTKSVPLVSSGRARNYWASGH